MSEDQPLVDDLADVLSRIVVGWKEMTGFDLTQAPDVVRVMARYRRSKSFPPDHDHPLTGLNKALADEAEAKPNRQEAE